MKRAVFLDMDGTLYSHTQGRIPLSASDAIAKARENGISVFGCTGRSVAELKSLIDDMGIMDAWITMNGAYCYNNEEVIHEEPISEEDMTFLVNTLRQTPFPVFFSTADELFINMYDEHVAEEMNKIHTPYPEILPLEASLQKKVYQLCPFAEEKLWRPIEDKMHVDCVRWTELALDVNAKGCCKGNGIKSFIDYYGLANGETYGFGDALNDLSMMEMCTHSIAMGNAHEKVKERAEYVTDHIDCDGLYKAFLRYGLIQQ